MAKVWRKTLHGALALLLLAICRIGPAQATSFYSDPSMLKSSAISINAAWESTPLGLGGGDYLISFKRGWTDTSGSGYRVTNIRTGAIVADFPSWAGFLGCALVDSLNSNRVVLFGINSDASNGNSLMVSVLNSDWSAQPATVALTAGSSDRFYNCSVDVDGSGYIMALEHSSGSTTFYRASNVAGPWSAVGGSIGSYACPTIRKGSDGYYYVFGASGAPGYRTMLARSMDLTTFQWATRNAGSTVLAADGPGNEGISGSDFDLANSAAMPGWVNVTYMVGDQSTWGAIKMALIPMNSDAWMQAQF